MESRNRIPLKYNANNPGVTDPERKHWALLQAAVQGAKIFKESRIGVYRRN